MAWFNGEKKIYHFKGVTQVDELQFSDDADPLVIYRGPNNTHITVDVQPFRDTKQAETDSLTFEQKTSYFETIVRDLKSFSEQDNTLRNDVYVKEVLGADVLGTLNEFIIKFNNPDIPTQTYAEFFESVFLDMDPNLLTEFVTAFDND